MKAPGTRSGTTRHLTNPAAPFFRLRFIAPQVTEGSGFFLVTAVGPKSEWGQTMALVQTEAENTPLQDKLEELAGQIAKAGFAAGIGTFIVLLIIWLVSVRSTEKVNQVLKVKFIPRARGAPVL